MWGATISLILTAAAVSYVAGAIAGLAVAAVGSALLLAGSLFAQRRTQCVETSGVLELVAGGAKRPFEFPLLRKKAS